MNQVPACIFCDVLSNLDYREVEDKRTVCDYWNKAIEKNPHILPRLIFNYLYIRDGEVYGHYEIYDRALLSYKEKYRTWNFLDGDNYAKLDSCHFKLCDIELQNEMELLQALYQRFGSKISIERIKVPFELFEDLKKLLPYTKVEEIYLYRVPSRVLLETPEKFFIPNQEMKIFKIISYGKFTYEVDEIMNLMAGNQCAISNRCVLVLKNASDEFIAAFAQNVLQVFRDAVDIEPFVKEIEVHSGLILYESSFKTDSIIKELRYQGVDYNYKLSTTPPGCGQWGPRYDYQHTFKERREDGWSLQMKLIKTTVKNKHIPIFQGVIKYTDWNLEICIFRDGAPLIESISTESLDSWD